METHYQTHYFKNIILQIWSFEGGKIYLHRPLISIKIAVAF